MIVVVSPGQGSQTPGFLSPWLEHDGVREQMETLGDAAKIDLVAHGTRSDDATIRDTKVAQPLIVAASIVSGTLLLENRRSRVSGFAGHSVGEFAAAVLAGILKESDAMSLVGVRGRAMADEAARVATGMSALIGGDEAVIASVLDKFGLFAANMNGGGQVVVAGTTEALDALASDPPEGIRVIPLTVAGAFHTSFMAGAVATLEAAATSVPAADPTTPIYSNNDGNLVTSGEKFRDLLVGQVSSPVRWDLCMESFARDGVSGVIELAPAGALVGLIRRTIKGVPTVAVKTPDDLSAAIEMLEAS